MHIVKKKKKSDWRPSYKSLQEFNKYIEFGWMYLVQNWSATKSNRDFSAEYIPGSLNFFNDLKWINFLEMTATAINFTYKKI